MPHSTCFSAYDEKAFEMGRVEGTGGPPASADPLRKVSPALFALVVLLFFLPFVSCNGVEVSGMQAATGRTPPGSDPAASQFRAQTVLPDGFVLASLACAVAGIGLIRLGRRRGPFASALAATVGVATLIAFTLQIAAKANGEIAIEFGLSLTFLGFLSAAALNDLLLAREPLREAGDQEALARQRSRAAMWFVGIGVALAISLFISGPATHRANRGANDDDIGAYLVYGLIPVAVLALVALVSAIRGYRRGRAKPVTEV